MSDKLMDIAAEYREAFDRLNDLDLPEEVVKDTLEGMAGALEVKATNLISYSDRLSAFSEQIKKRRTAMLARQQALETRAERIRFFVFNAMKFAQVKVIETTEYKLRIKGGTSKVIVDAPTQVPPEFMRFPDPPAPEIDKEKIKTILTDAASAQALFAAGKPLDAKQAQAIEDAKAITFAHLEQSEFLDVR
jgi:hypothetical protein